MATEITNIDNSSALANSLFNALTTGITLPDSPDFTDDKYNFTPDPTSILYQDVASVDIKDVTTDSLEGTGAFDIMMSAVEKHVEREYKAGRIVGDEYAKVYLGGLQSTLQNATNFAMNKERMKWEAITAQMQARIAEISATQALIELEKTKFETTTALFEMNLAGANYGLTKMKIATEEASHDSVTADVAIKHFQRNYQMPADLAVTQYERTAVQPSQVAMNEVQYRRILPAQASISEFQNRELQPIEKQLQILQRDEVIPTGVAIEKYKLNSMMPVELGQMKHMLELRMPAETNKIKEDMEVLRAQTMDTRLDGLTTHSGVIALQKRNLTADADIKEYQLNNRMPVDTALVSEQVNLTQEDVLLRQAQTANTAEDTLIKALTHTGQMPAQISLIGKQEDQIDAQILLVSEQREAERAKTLDSRSDGATVVGSVGKQKELYDQQIDSFIKDAQHKVAKMYLDAFITQKTLDEGLTPPTEFTSSPINSVIAAVKANNNL